LQATRDRLSTPVARGRFSALIKALTSGFAGLERLVSI
jgi:hypothetical protein